jgi:hypothetical protein
MSGFVIMVIVGFVVWMAVRAAKASASPPAPNPSASPVETVAVFEPKGVYRGLRYQVTWAADAAGPVTSLRITLRKSLPDGLALHPRGAAPWSSGRIGGQVATTGDAAFDGKFVVRADRPADARVFGRELRRTLLEAGESHPGLWLAGNGLVLVERGHLREPAAIEAVLDEMVVLSQIVSDGRAAPEPRAAAPGARAAGRPAPEKPPAFHVASAEPPAARGPGHPVDAFVAACFDRAVAAYEVNRRIGGTWMGRVISGQGVLAQTWDLDGHDFDFGDLPGAAAEIRLEGPESIVASVRVHVQLDPPGGTVREIPAGTPVRFSGTLVSANPLLASLQLRSGDVRRLS